MAQPVLIKVYAAFSPVDEKGAKAVEAACSSALAGEGELSCSSLGDLLRVSFEGVYFPVDEVAEVLEGLCARGAVGKMDVLDLEEWRLTRYQGAGGRQVKRSAPLTNVLDFSGF